MPNDNDDLDVGRQATDANAPVGEDIVVPGAVVVAVDVEEEEHQLPGVDCVPRSWSFDTILAMPVEDLSSELDFLAIDVSGMRKPVSKKALIKAAVLPTMGTDVQSDAVLSRRVDREFELAKLRLQAEFDQRKERLQAD